VSLGHRGGTPTVVNLSSIYSNSNIKGEIAIPLRQHSTRISEDKRVIEIALKSKNVTIHTYIVLTATIAVHVGNLQGSFIRAVEVVC
jgi:hypothetical protein